MHLRSGISELKPAEVFQLTLKPDSRSHVLTAAHLVLSSAATGVGHSSLHRLISCHAQLHPTTSCIQRLDRDEFCPRGRVHAGGHQQLSGRLAGCLWDGGRVKKVVLDSWSQFYAPALLHLRPAWCICIVVRSVCDGDRFSLPPSLALARCRGLPEAVPSRLQGCLLGSGWGTPLPAEPRAVSPSQVDP